MSRSRARSASSALSRAATGWSSSTSTCAAYAARTASRLRTFYCASGATTRVRPALLRPVRRRPLRGPMGARPHAGRLAERPEGHLPPQRKALHCRSSGGESPLDEPLNSRRFSVHFEPAASAPEQRPEATSSGRPVGRQRPRGSARPTSSRTLACRQTTVRIPRTSAVRPGASVFPTSTGASSPGAQPGCLRPLKRSGGELHEILRAGRRTPAQGRLERRPGNP